MDGCKNSEDMDDDNDSEPDATDAFDYDPCATTDSDMDGFPNSIADNCEAGDTGLIADAFPQDACATTDSDGDDFPDSLADGCASTTSPPLTEDIDDDNDGLIEIHDLTMLHNMRYNLAGTTYDDEEADTDPGDPGITTGGPTEETDNCKTATGGLYLCGYELMQDLDFDTDGDGTYTGTPTAPLWMMTTIWRPTLSTPPAGNL